MRASLLFLSSLAFSYGMIGLDTFSYSPNKGTKQEVMESARSNRTKRDISDSDSSMEIEEVNIVPVTPDDFPIIYCSKLSPGMVSCHHGDFLYNIKMKHNDLSDELVVSVVQSLYEKLAGTQERKRRDNENIVTLLPPPGQTPLIIVIPHTSPSPEQVREVIGCKIHKNCHYECQTTFRNFPVDSPFMIECCPADFEPRNPGQKEEVDTLAGTTHRVPAFIYSCKWQRKRGVESAVFMVPVGPPSIRIAVDPVDTRMNAIPVRISLVD